MRNSGTLDIKGQVWVCQIVVTTGCQIGRNSVAVDLAVTPNTIMEWYTLDKKSFPIRSALLNMLYYKKIKQKNLKEMEFEEIVV